MANPICYGDIVYLEFRNLILYGNGFYDEELYLVSTENISYRPFKNGLFKLYPNLSYKDIDQVDQLNHQLYLFRALDPDERFAASELKREIELEKEILGVHEAKLDALNDKINNEAKGHPIKYGHQIQLYHMASQSFLSVSKEFNKEDRTIKNLKLTSKGSQSLYFTFKPKLAFIQEGEIVEYDTPLKFLSCETDNPLVQGSKLDLSQFRTELNPQGNSLTNDDEKFVKVEPRRKEPLFQAASVYSCGIKMVDRPESTYIHKFISFKDQEKASKKKSLKNGDYIRISNDRVYLTGYEMRERNSLFFQTFGSHQEYKYNTVYTMFQILEVPENKVVHETSPLEKETLKALHLPRGHLLKYKENRKYMIKHVASEKYLAVNNGALTLLDFPTWEKNSKGISIMVKNKGKGNLQEKYVDRNSIAQLKFYNHIGGEQGTLAIGHGRKASISHSHLDLDAHFEPQITDNYLDNFLRAERYCSEINNHIAGQSSCFKFVQPTDDELFSVFLAESLANQFQKFIDFLDDFIKGHNNHTLQDFNAEINKLLDVSNRYAYQMFEETYNEDNENILRLNTVRQTLLREFRIFDLIFRCFHFTLLDKELLRRVKKFTKDFCEKTYTQPDIEQSIATSAIEITCKTDTQEELLKTEGILTDRDLPMEHKFNSDAKTENGVGYSNLLKLFGSLKRIVLISFRKNNGNQFYCSQFIRTSIECLLYTNLGIFSLASEEDILKAKEMFLALCKEGLWDKDLDALKQLNDYEESFFEAFETQKSFHTVYLELMNHISRSQAPHLQNDIRNNFAFSFIPRDGMIKHIFPHIYEDDGQVFIDFVRRTSRDKNFPICLNHLVRQALAPTFEKSLRQSKVKYLLKYLIEAIELIFALQTTNASMFDLMIVRYYRYETIIKAIDIMSKSSYCQELRAILIELISKLHQNYFNLPFTKLPAGIQITISKEEVVNSFFDEIELIVMDSINEGMVATELEFLKREDDESVFNTLRSLITSEDENITTLKLINLEIGIHDAEGVRVTMENIDKILEANTEADVDFLRRTRELILKLIKQAIEKRGRANFDFIKQALCLFNRLERKIVSIAAIDIVRNLKTQALLTLCPVALEDFKKKKDSRKETFSNLVEPSSIVRPIDKQNSFFSMNRFLSRKTDINELILKHDGFDAFAVSIVDDHASQWKSGAKLHRIKSDTLGHSDISKVFKIILDTILLEQDYLMSDIIKQLKTLSTFESLLYKEFDKISIIHNVNSLSKLKEVVRATIRLEEISRQIFFCQDVGMVIESDKMQSLAKETIECLWELFFIIYETSKHFKYRNEQEVNSQKRFRRAFETTKITQCDVCINLNPKAVNKLFQKAFNTLKTCKTLVKILHWAVEEAHKFDESEYFYTYITRLNILIFTAFIKDNKENQMLASTMQGFIKQFYNRKFTAITPDAMITFAEIFRNNKKLLKLPTRYLYDITVNYLVKPMTEKISNDQQTGFLSAGIMSFYFLNKAVIPSEFYNPIADMKQKWQEISQVSSFTSLNILNNHTDLIELPHCYYSIYGLFESTLDAMDHFASNSTNLNEMRQFLSFSSLLSFFESENFCLQYSLKNSLAKCAAQIYFQHNSKNDLIKEPQQCGKIIIHLVNDIIFFRKFMLKSIDQPNTHIQGLSEALMSIMNTYRYYEPLKISLKVKNIDLDSKHLQVSLEDIPLYHLLSEYVYDGCFDLLFSIIIYEADLCIKPVSINDEESSSLFDLVLMLVEEMIDSVSRSNQVSSQKIYKFLSKILESQIYERFGEEIVRITAKLDGKLVKFGRSLKQNQTEKSEKRSIQVMTSTERYSRVIEHLKSTRTEAKEKSIKMVADHIANHAESKWIIQEILKHLKQNISRIDKEEIVFTIRLLRKYIERENTNNSTNEPIYMWKQVKYSDLKKIERIQHLYRELGLSDMLYSLFAVNDSKIFRETLLLSLAYMYGGSRNIQNDFLMSFQMDDENQVISELSRRLNESWEVFRVKELERVQYSYKKGQKIMFNYLRDKKDYKEFDDKEQKDSLFESSLDQNYIQPANKKKSNKLFMLTLTFLQALCEKQFAKMQNFLREQKTDDHFHQKPFDFLIFLRHSMYTYYKILNKYNLPVGNKVLDLVTELVQGEVQENINVFMSKTFIYDMCRVLTDFNAKYHTFPRGFGTTPFHPDFQEFKGKIIFLFKTILENGNEDHIKVLTQHLNITGLMETLESFMSHFFSIHKKGRKDNLKSMERFISSLHSEDFKGIFGDAINIYIIFRYIWDDPNEFKEKMIELIRKMDKSKQDFMNTIIFSLCERIANSIEIIVSTKAQSLMRVWFPVIAVCHHLQKETKVHFMRSVDRSNSQTKISALLDSSHEFLPQMYSNYSIRGRLFTLHLFYYIIQGCVFALVLSINIMNLATYKYDDDDDSGAFQRPSDSISVKRMNVMQIAFSILLIILWLFLYRKSNRTLVWERYVDQNIKNSGFIPPTITNKLDSGQLEDLNSEECLLIMKLKGANSDEFKLMKEYSRAFRKIAFKYYLIHIFFSIRSFAFLWHWMFLGISIGSLFHPLVAIFQLFTIALWSETIKQIYASIYQNAGQFLWTIFLLVTTNIVYSSVGFFFLNDTFVDSQGHRLCETTFACFINVLNQGLRSGGGIGDTIRYQPYDSDHIGRFVGLAFFDLSFFIIMIILFLNLIFGMIIDAFGSLRDEKNYNEEDQKNVCFICGIYRAEFEKHTNFEKHVKKEHNIWAYVNYIAFLLEKQKNDKNSMTDIENLVLEKYLIKDNAWVPVGKSLTLDRIYEREKFSKDNELSRLTKKVHNVQDSLTQMNAFLKNTLVTTIKNTVSEVVNMQLNTTMKQNKEERE